MRLIPLLFLLSLYTLTACSPAPPPEPERLNVLLLYVDDLTDRLGCYGDTQVYTPNIDLLASQGTRFKNAYCQQALCTPSRSSMLTGLRPSSLGITGLKSHFRELRPELKSLPQVFREAGYFTGRAGKVFHMGVPDAIAMNSSGGDDPFAWDEAVNCPGYELNSNGVFKNLTPWETHGVGTGGAISWLRAEKSDDRHHDHRVATEVIRMMEAHQGEPFFLAAGFIRPHVPLVAPKRFFERYDSVEIKLPPGLVHDRKDMPTPAYKTWASDFNINAEDRKDAIRAYYACTTFVDEQVGRILARLKDLGLAENTVVLLVSDHGYQLGEHDLWFKNFLFRESAIAPMIWRVPGGKTQVLSQPVELLDVFPSLLEYCGLENLDQLEGQSFKGLMEGTATQWKNYALVEAGRGKESYAAIYTERWSYADWKSEGEELYSLRQDRHQLINLAGNPRFQPLKDSLAQILNTYYP